MAALDFPASPTVGQIFGATNGVNYQWNGTLWLAVGPASVTTPGGDFYAYTPGNISGMSAGVTVVVTGYTVATGNSGGWLNVSNGRFTPPAGRYQLVGMLSLFSSASLIIGTPGLRKNGIDIPGTNQYSSTSQAASQWTSITTEAIVDANGSDYFEMTAYGHVSASGSRAGFTAFPLSGIKGPPGDPGQLGWRLLKRVVPTAGQAAVDFTSADIPSDINDLEIRWSAKPTAATSNWPFLRFFDGSGALISTGYQWQGSYTNSISTAGSYAPQLNPLIAGGGYDAAFYVMGSIEVSNITGTFGRATINNIRDTGLRKNCDWQAGGNNGANTAAYSVVFSGLQGNVGAITGLRFGFGGTTFQAGGAISVWGSP